MQVYVPLYYPVHQSNKVEKSLFSIIDPVFSNKNTHLHWLQRIIYRVSTKQAATKDTG